MSETKFDDFYHMLSNLLSSPSIVMNKYGNQ